MTEHLDQHHRDQAITTIRGLQRDLLATGAVIDRRASAHGRESRRRRRRAASVRLRRKPDAARQAQRPLPQRRRRRPRRRPDLQPGTRGNAGPLSRRRLERAQRPQYDRRRPQRYPFELRRAFRRRRWRAAEHRAHDRPASTCAPLAGRAVYLWHCDRPGATRSIRRA